jgi:hypothetical protein
MSFYKQGLALQTTPKASAPTAYQRGLYGDQVGGFAFWRGIKTPGMIRDEVNRIHAEWISTGSDLINELERKGAYPSDLSKRPASVLPLVQWYDTAWGPIYRQWENFMNNHQSWTSNIWGDTWDDIQTWQTTLKKMRSEAKKAGYDLTASVEPVKTEADAGSLSSGLQSLMWTILKITLIGGVVFIIFMYISKRLG